MSRARNRDKSHAARSVESPKRIMGIGALFRLPWIAIPRKKRKKSAFKWLHCLTSSRSQIPPNANDVMAVVYCPEMTFSSENVAVVTIIKAQSTLFTVITTPSYAQVHLRGD